MAPALAVSRHDADQTTTRPRRERRAGGREDISEKISDTLYCRGVDWDVRDFAGLRRTARFRRCMDSGRQRPKAPGNRKYPALEAGRSPPDSAVERRGKGRSALPRAQPLSAARHAELDADDAQCV